MADSGLARRGQAFSLRPALQWRDARLAGLLRVLQAEADANYGNGRLYTESLGSALALHLVGNLGQAEPRLAYGFSARQQRLLQDYIDAHLDQDLSLAQLQAQVGLGASQFKLLFRRSFASPVHAYVVQRRVEQARRLIARGQASLAEIAAQTGFADQSHMARCMRRVLGVSPGELRRK
jgi:AraC family transcriptional regulator